MNLLKKPSFLTLLVLFVLLLNSAYAQIYTATAELDTAKILIGEQVSLTIDVRFPAELLKNKKHFVQWPPLNDTLSHEIEIVDKSTIDTTLSTDQKTLLLTQTFLITSFDSGFFVIPPLRFLKNGDSAKFFETQPLLLEVHSVAVDTTQAIKDIKAPIEAPFTLKEVMPYIIGGMALIAAILLIIYLVRKRKQKPVEIVVKEPEIPPHIIARNKLEEIKNRKLWQEGKVKLYHILLSETVRTYIEQRFNIKALEQTTDEIIQSCRSLDISGDSKAKLKQLLVLSDLVKFAKAHPLPNENELSINNAFDFVDATAPVEQEVKMNDEEVKQ